MNQLSTTVHMANSRLRTKYRQSVHLSHKLSAGLDSVVVGVQSPESKCVYVLQTHGLKISENVQKQILFEINPTAIVQKIHKSTPKEWKLVLNSISSCTLNCSKLKLLRTYFKTKHFSQLNSFSLRASIILIVISFVVLQINMHKIFSKSLRNTR